MSIYIVLRNSYGALSRPKGIWSDRGDAIDQAVSLSGGAEFTPTPSDSYRSEGHAKEGACWWAVFEYELDTPDEASSDTVENTV